QPREAHRLAAARYRSHPQQPRDNAAPIVELVAAHEHQFVGAVGFLDDAGARPFQVALSEVARPDRDALEMVRRNHDRPRQPAFCGATMPAIAAPLSARYTPTKITGQLSDARHFM